MTKHAHTAGWCQGVHSKGFNSVSLASTPDFIKLEYWPSKSPDLNVMDYCIWSFLLTET